MSPLLAIADFPIIPSNEVEVLADLVIHAHKGTQDT